VRRRTLIYGLIALCASVSRATAAAWALITSEEFANDLAAAEPVTIDLSSLRVTYGWLGVDIAKRVMEHAHVVASGLLAENADIPAGYHRVTLQIADNMHRVGVRTFEFIVV